MDRSKEAALFDNLYRNQPLRDWLEAQLADQVKILLVNPQHEAILKAQGAAAFLRLMQDKLTAAESAANR